MAPRDRNPLPEEVRRMVGLEPVPNLSPEINPLLAGRVRLGNAIQNGIEPPEELEHDVILKGKVHVLYAGAGMGKTLLALKLIKNAIERGENVIYLDTENMERIVSERLSALGVDPELVDRYLFYLPSPHMPGSKRAAAEYSDMLDKVKPSLIVFDSWINFLAGAGLSENENTDIAHWAVVYLHPARDRGTAVILLDHVPHDGSHARGATRKKDEADVVWRLRKTKHFDRDSVGEITLQLEKDREGWLPPSVTYSIGGTMDGFTCERSAGTFEPPAENGGLEKSHEGALEALHILGEATDKEWKKAASVGPFLVSRTSFYRAKKKLIDIGSVVEEDKRFKVVSPTSPTRSHGSPVGRDEFSPTSPTTLKGGTNGTKSGTSTPSSLAAAQAGRDRRLTLDQKEKIENLKANGWAESAARAQVLREDL